jgi:hypothetical protein
MSDENKKQDTKSEESFLNSAARVVGTTLGRLAAKTGLAHGDNKPQSPAAKSLTSPKKKSARLGSGTIAKRAKPFAKKKTVVRKKASRTVTKTKPRTE